MGDELLVVSVAAYSQPPESSRWLLQSAQRYGYKVTIIGEGQAYKNDLQKFRLVAEYLAAHPGYQYVLSVDFRDVIFCASPRELIGKYHRIGHDVVAAAERSAWPLASHRDRSPPLATSYRYLNAGTIFSTADAWQASWATIQRWQRDRDADVHPPEIGQLWRDVFSCDQAAWSELYIRKEQDIVIDSQCELFQPLTTICHRVAGDNPDLCLEGCRVRNRETGTHPCILHANGQANVEAWGRYVMQPEPRWNWPLIERLRTAPLDSLRDAAFVAELLCELGLHAAGSDNYDLPLLPFTGKGLSIRQQPVEFARYLTWLALQPPIRSYMEIGVEAGGSFITTVEYLRRFHPLVFAVGVDPRLSATVGDYVARSNGTFFIRGTRDSRELRSLIERVGQIDLTLIDGDHSDEAVRADWEFARRHSRYVAFHGIVSPCEGVRQLWSEIHRSYRRTPDFSERRDGRDEWGLGLVDLAYGKDTAATSVSRSREHSGPTGRV